MSLICMTSSRAATRGAIFLPVVVAGATKASWSRHQGGGERRDILGEIVGVSRVVGDMDLADAGDLRGRLGDAADALAGDEQVDLAQLRRGGDRGERGVLHLAAFMFDENQRLHATTPRAFSLPISSSTSPTLTPGLALGRLDDLQRRSAAARCRRRNRRASSVASGLDLAFMMLGSDA